MDRKTSIHRKRARRRLRASIFLRKNGLYIALGLCLAIMGGVTAAIFGAGGSKKTPAENSFDERLSEAQTGMDKPDATKPPFGIKIPFTVDGTPKPTAAPSVVPDMTPAPSKEPDPVPAANWTPPVDGRLIRVYAMDCLIYSKTLGQWMTHSGVDIAAPKGTEVRAVDAGTVKKVYDDDMLGTTVAIEHANGAVTVYAGLKKEPPVKEGDSVEARGLIGYIGDTAISECAEESHLHFEIWIAGKPVDPETCIVFKKNG